MNLLIYIFSLISISGCFNNVSEATIPVTETSLSYQVVPSLTAIPIPTKTPLPINTLTALERQNFVRESLSDGLDCNLPCWWGITPGVTTWKEAYEILAPLGYVAPPIIHENFTRYEFEFAVPNELSSLGYFWPKLVVINDIVTTISINTSYIEHGFDFSLSGILRSFGSPEEIWIKPTIESMTNIPFYEINLFYPTKGVLISANGDAEIKDNNFIICPNEFKLDNYPPSILLWTPQQKVEFGEISMSLLGNSTWDTSGHYQIKELTTEFVEKDFYYTYLNPTSVSCFSFSINRVR